MYGTRLLLSVFNTARVQELLPPVYQVEKHALVRGLCEGVKLDVYFPGFPTLKHIPHSAQLEKCGVRVFQAASRDDNVILTVARDDQEALAVSFRVVRSFKICIFSCCCCCCCCCCSGYDETGQAAPREASICRLASFSGG